MGQLVETRIRVSIVAVVGYDGADDYRSTIRREYASLQLKDNSQNLKPPLLVKETDPTFYGRYLSIPSLSEQCQITPKTGLSRA